MKAPLLVLLAIAITAGSAVAASPEDAATEARIRKKLEKIIIPRLEFREATLPEAIEFLKKKSVELDDENPHEVYRGSLTLDVKPEKPRATSSKPLATLIAPELQDKQITLSLRNVSIYEALQKVTAATGAKFWIRADGVYVGLTEPESAAPAPKNGTPAANEKPRK